MFDWNGLFQALVANALWETIIVGGGVLIAIIRAKKPEWASPALYGVVGTTCLAIVFFAFTGRPVLSKQLRLTPDNLETYIRKWSDAAGLSVARIPELPQADYFGLLVTLKSNNQITLFVAKDEPAFLQVQCALALSTEHLGMLGKLNKQQSDDAIEEITLEMNRARIGYIMSSAAAPPIQNSQASTTGPAILQQTILITEPIAISNELNEASFVHRLNQIDSDIGIVRGVTDLTLKRLSKANELSVKQQ